MPPPLIYIHWHSAIFMLTLDLNLNPLPLIHRVHCTVYSQAVSLLMIALSFVFIVFIWNFFVSWILCFCILLLFVLLFQMCFYFCISRKVEWYKNDLSSLSLYMWYRMFSNKVNPCPSDGSDTTQAGLHFSSDTFSWWNDKCVHLLKFQMPP